MYRPINILFLLIYFLMSCSPKSRGAQLSGTDGTAHAPDGMSINYPVKGGITDPTLLALIAKAKKAEVPQRVQTGPTCGLYALGMVMDYWHKKNAQNPTAFVQNSDPDHIGTAYNYSPTNYERILSYVQKMGYTSLGEMFTAKQLALTAIHYGYRASFYSAATAQNIYAALDLNHPVIIAFDVDGDGNPTSAGGMRAHYAVLEGYLDLNGTRYVVARHGWGLQKDYLWREADLMASMKNLTHTNFYGHPGDDIVPNYPKIHEPSKLDLPAYGSDMADIQASLGDKMIEVFPASETAAGGELL